MSQQHIKQEPILKTILYIFITIILAICLIYFSTNIYQQCIATLNAIAEIIDNIPKLNINNTETEEEIEDKGEPVEQDEESSDSLNVSDSSMSDYQEESVDYFSDYNDLF